LPLPSLKHWRLRKRLSQRELARRAGLTSDHLFKIESGRRGCNPETAQLLADLLKVDLQDLRRRRDDALDAKAPPKPSRTRIPYRNVHQAYLRIILDGAVGSSYAAMDEWEIEERCEEGTWEDVREAVRARTVPEGLVYGGAMLPLFTEVRGRFILRRSSS
jgi:transcriptional regulator with XRE-family HTH domain